MKSIFFVLAAVCSVCVAAAQDAAFTQVALCTAHKRTVLAFTVKREVNVRHYRIEAADDSVHFGVIATVVPGGNGLFPASYRYDVTVLRYRYYRVAMVGMDGTMPYSGRVTRPQEQYPDYREVPAVPAYTTQTLTAR